MKRKNNILAALISLFMIQQVFCQQPDHHFKIVSPPFMISHIPSDIHIQKQTKEGQIDTTFHETVHIDGFFQQLDKQNIPTQEVYSFHRGELKINNVALTGSENGHFILRNGSYTYPMYLRMIPGILTLVPPLLAILLAIIFRQVIISLFAGIWLGATLIFGYNPFLGLLRTLDQYLVNSLANPDHAAIILFTMTLGGMTGILSRSGGTQGIVQKISKWAGHVRGGQLAAWAMGVFIFFDDYANTLIVGNTMRPITDRLRISREKLAYIVDSTAAPVTSFAIFSTWIGFELGLIQSSFDHLGIDRNVYMTYLQTIPFRFYSLLTLVFVFLVGLTGRDFGPMLDAEKRSQKQGKVLRDNASPLMDTHLLQMKLSENIPRRWYNAVIPVLVVIISTAIGLWYSGRSTLIAQGLENISLKDIIGATDTFSVLMWASFSGSLTAGLLVVSQKILNIRQTLDAWISGAKSMLTAIIILLFAWSIGKICEDLHTADYIIQITQNLLSPYLLPMITFLIAAFISFATGTSWGTMSILIPIIVPMAYRFTGGLTSDNSTTILIGTIASVLSGSVFGDHCSPISDTTIMSSMSSGSDHIDHVRTQMPYAVFVAIIALVVGYIPAGFGLHPVFSLSTGIVLLIFLLSILGKKSMV
jgi:Na+/H+ antiporter NhaC